MVGRMGRPICASGDRLAGGEIGEAGEAFETSDSEVALEQAHLDRSNRGLGAMRRRAEQLLADLRAAGQPDLDYEAALARRVAQLGASSRPLLFGRIDEQSGETWRIGRRHVEEVDGSDEVLVVDWRAPISTPFYRASVDEPLGLRRRRQIMVDGGRVLTVADDVLLGGRSEGDSEVGSTRLRGGDALLAELERARTGEMLDIVATIQAEQDQIIRSPLDGLLAVQGGPGTGKTAVALHRAAYLLFNHPELSRSGVLVVGPSRAFLRYVAQVLPSLGEESVLQVTILDLVPRTRVRGEDSPLAARTKGDPRMVSVLRRSLEELRGRLAGPVSLKARHRVLTLEPDEVNELAETIASRSMPYKAGRSALQARLVSLARHRMRRQGRHEADEPWFGKELASTPEFGRLRDLLWPAVSPAQLVSELLARPALLERAGAGLLDAGELAALRRPRPVTLGRALWTRDDVALLDEAHFLLAGQARHYGHVVVDEVQDLTPMQLRMIARRAPKGSMTLLGDIAQAAGTWSYQSWDEILPHVPVLDPSQVRREQLTLGYRAPGKVLDLAARLLPASAPGVPPTASVRPGRYEPEVHRVATPEDLAGAALAEARRLASPEEPPREGEAAAAGMLVGLVVPPGAVEQAVQQAAGKAADVGRLDQDGITRPVTIVAAPSAKGLEFDAVVVVEPAAIAAEEAGVKGLRLLYVALTRPIQRLSIVHCEELPALLRS